MGDIVIVVKSLVHKLLLLLRLDIQSGYFEASQSDEFLGLTSMSSTFPENRGISPFQQLVEQKKARSTASGKKIEKYEPLSDTYLVHVVIGKSAVRFCGQARKNSFGLSDVAELIWAFIPDHQFTDRLRATIEEHVRRYG